MYSDSSPSKETVTVASFARLIVQRVLPPRALLLVKKFYYQRALSTFDQSKEPAIEIVKALALKGSTAIDAGANIGLYTVQLSNAVGDSGKVHAFEPVPATAEILRSVTKNLPFSNVTVHNLALSDEAGKVSMVIPQYSDGRDNFYQAHIVDAVVEEGPANLSVPTATLDSVIADEFGKVSLLKIDVEGNELKVIRGAQRLLEHDRPACLVEIIDDPNVKGSSAELLFNMFMGLAYQVYILDGNTLRLRAQGQRDTNYFFLQQEHVEQLRSAGVLRT